MLSIADPAAHSLFGGGRTGVRSEAHGVQRLICKFREPAKQLAMPVTVKSIVLWRRELENKAGVLAGVLEPLAGARADLQVVMGYRYPGNQAMAALELYPVTGKKSADAAKGAGLSAAAIPTLLVEGDNRPGLGYAISKAMADAAINMDFLVAQVIGRMYSAVIGFENAADAKRAATLIKRATKR